MTGMKLNWLSRSNLRWKWIIAPKRERVHMRDAITYLCSYHPIQNPEWVDAKNARLPPYQKSTKDTAKTKKKNRKRPKDSALKEAHVKVSKKKAKLTSSSGADKGFKYPSTIKGREVGSTTLERVKNPVRGFLKQTSYVVAQQTNASGAATTTTTSNFIHVSFPDEGMTGGFPETSFSQPVAPRGIYSETSCLVIKLIHLMPLPLGASGLYDARHA
ncbi:unnamed protein product [Malus baccata var. baccata]